MSAKDGGPAFPHVAELVSHSADCMVTKQITSGGMSLRDYFAAKAMPMLAAQFYSMKMELQDCTVPDLVSKAAYEFADAMIRARDA